MFPSYITNPLALTFGGLSLLVFIKGSVNLSARAEAYLKHLWLYFLIFATAEVLAFTSSVWILAAVSFAALREYFSLIDIRFQDRWGLWGAYLAIPFMTYFIQIDWYGMFIISVPIYTFLIVPFLIALGGNETRGTVFSIGAIDLGLFLFVYCAGHIGYLMLFSYWAAVILVINVTISDGLAYLLSSLGRRPERIMTAGYFAAIPLTTAVSVISSGLTGIPASHSAILGVITPAMVAVGRFTMTFIEADLGIGKDYDHLRRGRLINSSCSLLFASPVVFHYIRYFLT